MRRIFFIIMICMSVNLMGQGNPIQCDSVIQEPGKTAQQLYPMIRAWVATSFNSANDVIQMDDPQNGVMICKGCFEYKGPGGVTYRCIDGFVDYTLKIQVRDGRYKVTMGDFYHRSMDVRFGKTWSLGLITDREQFKEKGMQDKRWKKTWPDLKLKSKIEFFKAIVSLSEATSGKSNLIDTEDDW